MPMRAPKAGRAWALTISEHTSNRAMWQYVHDAYCHVHEDIMRHGTGDRNDDAILENEGEQAEEAAGRPLLLSRR